MRARLTALTLGGLFLTAACAPMDGGGMTPPPPDHGPDQCRAAQYQSYVGRNRSTLPPRPAGEVWRVTCTTCAVTMDYSPSRLNVFYDEASGIIREVRCG